MKSPFRSWGHLATCGAMLAFAGCGRPAPQTPPVAAEEHHHEGDGHDHAHPAEGPHHGHLIELGEEEYHAELVHDDTAHTITIYLLDSSAKQAVPIASETVTLNLVADGKPMQFSLKSAPDANDPAGQSSRFELTDEKLHDALEAESAQGRLNVTIGEKSYTGEIAHAAHEHDAAHEHEGEHEHEEAHTN